MSIHLGWLRAGRAPRGTPGGAFRPRRLVALGLIAGLAMIQAGCTSGPFGNGGGCSSCGFLRRTTARVFHRGGCSSCGSSMVGDSPVEYASPPTTVIGPSTSGGSVYSGSPSTSTVPSTVPPPPDTPTTLEKIPSARPGAAPGTSSTGGSGAGRTSYFGRPSATKTAVRLDGGPATERASITRPAGDPTRDGPAAAGEEDNPLDHLPPLGLPGEVTQTATESPAPSAARPEGKAGDSGVSGGTSDAADEAVSLLPSATTPEPEAGPATGIARFASVDPKLAAGSLPTSAGLAWLAEKGYRTVLDLRPSGEVSPAFLAEAAAKGLRYLAMPVGLDALDAERLARFQFELAAPEARPLYFFDGDGSRAGALWYVRRVTADHVDPQLARREAEEIGLRDAGAWRMTTAFLDRLEAAKAHPGQNRTGAADPPRPPAAANSASASPAATKVSEGEPAPATGPAAGSIVTSDNRSGAAVAPKLAVPTAAPTSGRPAGGGLPMQDSQIWKPFAAMILTGLTLPLAYFTRTAIPEVIARARASLPAPAHRPKSLPRGSGG